MNLRTLYYNLSPKLRLLARKVVYLPIDTLHSLMGKRSKYEPPKGDIYIGSGDFIQQGQHHLDLLKRYIDLQGSDVVLDIGSGIGRTAVALTSYLNANGGYEGFDVVEKGVKWCNEKIKKDFPNFNFRYVPLNNDLYNNSKAEASKFKFPYPDNTFDKTYLFSVFTHMKIEEIAHYLLEIERVLKPNGLCLSTFFIYSSQIESEIANRKTFNFPVKKEGYRLMNEDVQSANIAIEDRTLNEMVEAARLTKVQWIPGYWKDAHLKTSKNDFQDILILKKK